MDKSYVIDRFEGSLAVLAPKDGGCSVNVPRGELPEDAREGSTVVRGDGGWRLNQADTAERAERVRRLMGQVFKR